MFRHGPPGRCRREAKVAIRFGKEFRPLVLSQPAGSQAGRLRIADTPAHGRVGGTDRFNSGERDSRRGFQATDFMRGEESKEPGLADRGEHFVHQSGFLLSFAKIFPD